MKALEYFSHDVDASTHPKFEHLRSRYGWAGEGQFWALNGIIAQQEDGELDISRHFVRGTLAARFGMTGEEFMAFVKFLAEECELIQWNDDVIWTDRVKEDLGRVQTKRSRQRAWVGKRRSAPHPDDLPPPPPAPEGEPDEPREEAAPAPPRAARKRARPSPATATQPEPADGLPAVVPAAPVPARSISSADPLYDWIWNGFHDAQEGFFPNYPREGKATKELCRLAKTYAPADPEGFFREALKTFRELRTSDRWIGEQLFVPSTMAMQSVFGRVVERMRASGASEDVSWIDAAAEA